MRRPSAPAGDTAFIANPTGTPPDGNRCSSGASRGRGRCRGRGRNHGRNGDGGGRTSWGRGTGVRPLDLAISPATILLAQEAHDLPAAFLGPSLRMDPGWSSIRGLHPHGPVVGHLNRGLPIGDHTWAMQQPAKEFLGQGPFTPDNRPTSARRSRLLHRLLPTLFTISRAGINLVSLLQ
ncbi:hypothetical protein GUJ93_ZPchr0004g38192 [Zizania palustris]|uniref:Uncharacterized protein n=1 Tax=Zizania palustris TaxID=103762 RepID=A0A8J5S5F2_ZIZPA|nr:hypothetical protein GUJ93_ZPchr0004g38192 [Zizania palustris]